MHTTMKGENTATTTTTVDELADIVQSLNIGTSVQQNDTRESEDTAQAGDAVVPDSHESEPEESQELVVDEAVPDVDNVRVYEPRLGRRTKTIFGKGMSSLDHIVDMISQGKAKKIVVMAGAGISTAAGIPDFRSPGTGLYANLAKFDLPYPEAIFTMDYFEENPKPFFVLAKELYPDLYIPTLSHFFVKLLESKGVLLRHYTQNIDCLDSIAGVSDDLVVEAHGSFKTAHCINEDCREEHSKEWVRDLVFRDEIPHCRRCGSLVKPDITFFGEGLPKRFFDLMHDDLDQCDLLMVMGTSLAVHPFAGLVNLVSKSVPRLLINRERVGESKARGVGLDFDGRFASAVHRDALMLGDCDAACVLLADRLGWKPELLALRREFLAARQTTA